MEQEIPIFFLKARKVYPGQANNSITFRLVSEKKSVTVIFLI